MISVYLVMFWAMQVFANVAFKYGSKGERGHSKRWLTGFISGNIVGAASIYFFMKIFESMPRNSNLASALGTGGAFVASQIVLAWIFRSRLALNQWAGIALIAAGMAVATLAAGATSF